MNAFVTWTCSPSFNRKENGKKTAKKYHTVGTTQTPMDSPYKEAHMYMTAKIPDLLQAFTHHRILLGQALCICIFSSFLIKGNDKQ
jgi:hypothetical protein